MTMYEKIRNMTVDSLRGFSWMETGLRICRQMLVPIFARNATLHRNAPTKNVLPLW